MDFKVLRNKRVVGFDGNLEYDLTDATYSNSITARYIDVFEVTEFYAMRWDNISFKYYNTPDLADALMLFNQYENPFSLNVGDIILIPIQDDLSRNIVRDTTEYQTQSQNISTTDNNRKKFVDRNRQKFLAGQKLPPTFTTKPSIIVNGDGTTTLAK